MVNLSHLIQVNQRRLANAHRICGTCTGSGPTEPIKCESLDCPWLFSRKRAENKGDFLVAVQRLLNDLNYGMETGTLYEDVSEDGDERMSIARDDNDYGFTTPESYVFDPTSAALALTKRCLVHLQYKKSYGLVWNRRPLGLANMSLRQHRTRC